MTEDGVMVEESWYHDGLLHRTDGPAFRVMDDDGNLNQEMWFIHGEEQECCFWTRHSNGNVDFKQWSLNGELHRIDGPAKITWSIYGGFLEKEMWFIHGEEQKTCAWTWYRDDCPAGKYWTLDGVPHRIDGPASQNWDEDGNLKSEVWYQSGVPHRIDGPAEIVLRGGLITAEAWYKNGEKHRIDGPALSHYSTWNKTCQSECWYQNGRKHRIDGPAMWWFCEGKKFEEWYKNDRLHREDGPAVFHPYLRDFTGGDARSCWYQDGLKHREGGPTEWQFETWSRRDQTDLYCMEKSFYLHGKLHRLDGPTYVKYGTGVPQSRREKALVSGREKVLRASRLLILASAVQCVSTDSLSIIGAFL